MARGCLAGQLLNSSRPLMPEESRFLSDGKRVTSKNAHYIMPAKRTHVINSERARAGAERARGRCQGPSVGSRIASPGQAPQRQPGKRIFLYVE
jgi:hypothetical protein